MKILSKLLLTLIPTLTGCVAVNGSFTGVAQGTPEIGLEVVEKKFIGVPWLVGVEGSVVRLNSEWMITAAHNSLMITQELIKHPTCDIAVYRDIDESKGQTPVGLLYGNQDAFMIGYPPSPMPITSQKGKYIGDVNNNSWSKDCTFSALDNSAISGMSGGAVINDKGELVGITHAIMDGTVEWENGFSHHRPVLFTPLLKVADWLYEVTGVKLNKGE